MGTTADKLQAVLNAKNAIKTKFNLPDSLPFSQYADNIKITDGGGGNNEASGGTCVFYQCVSREYQGAYPAYYDLQLGGSADGAILSPMQLKCVHLASGFSRFWESSDSTSRISAYIIYKTAGSEVKLENGSAMTLQDGAWCLFYNNYAAATATTSNEHDEPYNLSWSTLTDWSYEIDKGTEYPAFEGIRTWRGAKIVQGSDGNYTVDNTDIQDLSFSEDRIVQIGNIYNHDATIEAAWLYKNMGFYDKYLCTYVNRTYETGEFTVSGLPDDAFKDLADWEGNPYPEEYRTKNPNGTYAPYYKEGELSGWKFRNEHGTVCYWNGEWMAWVFAPFAQGETDYWLSWFPARGRCDWENMKYPWDPTIEWVDGNTDSPISGFAIAPVIPPPVEPYWNGYKLTMNENGKYDIDYSEEHKLTYADFMPVAGRFYDGGCTVEIQGLKLEEKYLSSTPTNMISNEDAEWQISASHEHSYLSDTYPAYYAFDGTDKSWNSANDDSSNTFIQWQNKTHKVLLKQLDIYAYNWEEMPKLNEPDSNYGGAYIEGSNDGEIWKRLTVTLPNGFEYSKGCASFKLTDNYEFFSYYRIRRNHGTSHWVIKEIKGTYLNEREVPK